MFKSPSAAAMWYDKVNFVDEHNLLLVSRHAQSVIKRWKKRNNDNNDNEGTTGTNDEYSNDGDLDDAYEDLEDESPQAPLKSCTNCTGKAKGKKHQESEVKSHKQPM
jgi:hypothetical protein